MFKNLTYRIRLVYLGVGFIIFLFLVFKLAINRTIDLKKQCNQHEMQLSKLQNAPQQMAVIKSKLHEIDNRVGEKNIDQINFEELIIEKISKYCKSNNLILKEYPGIHTFTQQDYKTETCKITIEGSFKKLLKLAYGIEKDFSYGKVSSLNFYTEKNYKTKKLELLLEIYVQNIKMIKDE